MQHLQDVSVPIITACLLWLLHHTVDKQKESTQVVEVAALYMLNCVQKRTTCYEVEKIQMKRGCQAA